jgi:hypothetical protein
MNESTAGAPAAPSTTAAPTTAAPAAPVAGAQTGAAPVAETAAPIGREAARSSILQDAASGIEKIIGAPEAATTTGDAAAAAPPAASVDATKPAAGDALEIHPESGPSPELGSLKLRFKAGDGTYAPVPKDLVGQKFELEVGGKTIVKDLSGIARLAADGIANQRHANENHQLRTQIVPQFQQQVGTLQQQLDAQIALNRELLSDEAKYVARRQEWMDLNSPEQRADRAERALVDRDRLATQHAQGQQSVAYYNANVLPALKSVTTDAATVTNEEILGRMMMQTSHLATAPNGTVPPENYPKVAAYIRDSLAPWAKALHAQRTQADTARRETEERQQRDRVADAQRERQLATRDVSAFVPAATGGTPLSPNSQAQSPPRSRAEARRQILDSAASQASA